SWDGVFHQSIKLPENIHGIPLCDNFFVRDNLFLGHFRNHKGDFLHNFALYNQSSEVIKSFDNYVQFNPKVLVTGWVNRCMKPYRIGEHIYVKEISNDTLFYLNERNGLIPHFVFDLGKYTITKEMRESREPSNLYSVNGQINLPTSMPMIDTQNNLFFSFSAYNLSGKYSFPKKMNRSIVTPSSSGLIIFQGGGTIIDSHAVLGVYDTTNQTTQLLDTDPVTQIIGLINDLDGGLSFWPQYYTSENELVDIWRVEDMKEHLTDEYFAGHEIKDPAAHQKLKELVQKLDIEDNPVIVTAKLKPN
ncbi:RNA-binding domain-containing protein, partial [Parabacteroides sp. OttesenSCG-928-G21]|nr:RNA-binding domain-containing protein [Parabacteroides sp. OttesenSCG-928-G21]